MEDKNKFISSATDEELWASPMDLYSENVRNEKGIMMSTPNLGPWKSLSLSLEGSAGSSLHDSGYCSFTPSSTTSFQEELLSRRCQWCSKIPRENYEFSPPPSICNCKKRLLPKIPSSNIDYLQTISETKSSSSGLFLSHGRPNLSTDLFDESMDTSLYSDEPAVENHQGENHGCQPMEIGDEKSIDFIDSNLLYLSKDTSSDTTENKEEECKFREFSSQMPVLSCDATTPQLKKIIENEKSDDNFLSVAKKVVSMNRVVKSFSLNGIEKLDILYQLTSKRLHCPHIVSKIFSFLSEKDLDSVGIVSKLWNELLCNDFPAYNRWKLYKTTLQKTLWNENHTSPTKDGLPGWRTRASPLGPLQDIENETRPPRSGSLNSHRRSPPVSPQSARFRSFQKAAKALKKGERLLPCPKCFFPAHDHGNPTLQCSRSGCRHRFCVWCRNEIFTGVHHDCPPCYTPRSQTNSSYKIAAVGSKTFKRRLRRLTLDS